MANIPRRFSLRNLTLAIGGLLALLAVVIGGTIAWLMLFRPLLRPLTDRKYVSSPQRLERGRYIVENLAACLGCHSPNEMRRPVPGTEGSGWILPVRPHRIVAPNITPDPETGIGRWTDDEIGRAIREGADRNGRSFTIPMPSRLYKSMADEDLASIVVYLRSLKPVRNRLPETSLFFPVQFLVRTVPEPVTSPVRLDQSTAEKRGEYLVMIATCTECHGSHNSTRHPVKGMEFAGGDGMRLNSEPTTIPNITPDETGIKNVTPEMFREIMRTGQRAGRKLRPLMPCDQYAGLTEADLNDMYSYLRTLRPVKHLVDTLAAATYCRVCGNRHGGGERN